jgi:hypothetical protein
VGEHLTRSGSANNAGAEAVDDIVREALAMSGSANNSSSASNSSSGDDSESDDEMPPLDPPEAGSPAVHYASLTCDDLYIRDARPPPLTTERKHQECGICLDVKSRPVSYVYFVFQIGFLSFIQVCWPGTSAGIAIAMCASASGWSATGVAPNAKR